MSRRRVQVNAQVHARNFEQQTSPGQDDTSTQSIAVMSLSKPAVIIDGTPRYSPNDLFGDDLTSLSIQLEDGRTAVPVGSDEWEIDGRTALRNEDGTWSIEPNWAEYGDVTPEQELRASGHPAAQAADYEPPEARRG